MSIDYKEFEKKYKAYQENQNSRWTFGNRILYDMCEQNPDNTDEDIVVGKIWLIGRSYAAAIERKPKGSGKKGDDFYYDIVAPKMVKIGGKLDKHIKDLRNSNGSIADNVKAILKTHRFLMDTFKEITGQNKRSLASKYLHFHCSDKFYIYDSRANTAVRKIVKCPDTHVLSEMNNKEYDADYGNFVCRMIELQNYLSEKSDETPTTRDMDNFLLTGV